MSLQNLLTEESTQDSGDDGFKLLTQFERHREFCRMLQDAWVLVSLKGEVLKYNQMFCALVGLKAAEIRKTPNIYALLAKLEQDDAPDHLQQIVNSPKHLRIDEVNLVQRAAQKELRTILSNHPFFDENNKHIGCCLLLRDVTAETSLQGKYTERTLESILDPLTGLYSRRYLDRLISDSSKPIAEFTALTRKLSVLMCDIDFFKKVNDTYGHLTGDHILVTVSEAIKLVCRSTDSVVRYGGEEFAVILPETSLEGACTAAEKIRKAVEALSIETTHGAVQVTISIGASENSSLSEPIKGILERADLCLYKAKELGRNTVIAQKAGGFFTVLKDGKLKEVSTATAS